MRFLAALLFWALVYAISFLIMCSNVEDEDEEEQVESAWELVYREADSASSSIGSSSSAP